MQNEQGAGEQGEQDAGEQCEQSESAAGRRRPQDVRRSIRKPTAKRYQIKMVAGRCAADGGDIADQDNSARGRRRRRANPKLPIANGGGGEALIPC